MSDKEEVKLAVSDYNLQTISTTEYEEVIKTSIQSGTNLAVFSRRGSGKTSIAKQSIASTEVDPETPGLKAKEVYINLSVVERTDMGGYPDMFGTMNNKESKAERFVNFILPKFYEPLMTGDQPVAVIFDEVDKADPSVHAPLLEISQFRSINGRSLPNLRSCIFTGNLISEGSQRPSLPLLDRAEKYLLKADTTSFLAWAAKSNKIHPSIRAFLNDKSSQLYGSNDGGADLYAEQSPRGWENASNVLHFGEKHKWSKDLLNMKVAGFVGKEAGLQYQIYFEHYRELLPMIDKLFDGQNINAEYKSKDPSKQIYASMIACSRLAGILDKVPLDNDGKPVLRPVELGYIGKFMKKSVDDENVLISIRTQLTLQRVLKWDIDSDKNWGNLLNDITATVGA